MRSLLVIILISASAIAQNCPTTQPSGLAAGICTPALPDHLLITPSSVVLGIGQSQKMQATMVWSDTSQGQIGDTSSLCAGAWGSSATGVATVDGNGNVTAVSAGTSTISCTTQNTSCSGNANCNGSQIVTVLNAPNFQNPSQSCTQPCSLPNGLGPSSPVAYSFTFQATGGVLPYTWSISAGSLPGWASLNSSTGAITGTPNAIATTTFTARVCDNISSCNTMQVSLQVVANVTTFFPNSTTSQLANNKVAGQNSTVPTALWGTAASTTYSVTTNVATINVANTFVSGEIVGISGCTSATFLNGTILVTNGSTTGSAVVGAWKNTQGTALTHANVGSTADTTCYLQGQGWQPFVTATFPAPGSTSCTQGNPCVGQSGVLTTADINSWAFCDWAVPSTTLNTAPKNICTMMTNPAAQAGSAYHPSHSGEPYDQLISLDDGAGGYFIPMVGGGANQYSHVHLGTCGSGNCVLEDTPVTSGWALITKCSDAAMSLTQRPGVNKALLYCLNLTNQLAPVLQSQILTYNATGCAGQPCVTAGAPTTIANFSTLCAWAGNGIPWAYTTIGGYANGTATGGLVSASAMQVASSDGLNDTDWEISLGSGGQNGPTRHMTFHISNGGARCDVWDTQGYSGTGLFSLGISAGAGGTGYHVNDTVAFALPGTQCVGTVSVSTVNGSGGVTGIGTPTMSVNSGCTLGATMPAVGGAGSSLVLIITGIGTPSTPCCETVWTFNSSTPATSTWQTFGIHGGNMQRKGDWMALGGWGQTAQGTAACGSCDSMYWNVGTTTLQGQTSGLLAGHPAPGYTLKGTSTNPAYTVFLASDPTCTPTSHCPAIFTGLPSGLNHSTFPTPLFNDTYPIIVSSAPNNGQPSNPPNWTGPFNFSLWGIEQNGTTHWLFHGMENSNNTAEDFNAKQAIHMCSQDMKFCLISMDAFSGFAGNLGLGTQTGGLIPYATTFAVYLN